MDQKFIAETPKLLQDKAEPSMLLVYGRTLNGLHLFKNKGNNGELKLHKTK